ncbi:MAG: beta-N-acetylhexosaminidase [Alphaproteobacteria bacterium]
MSSGADGARLTAAIVGCSGSVLSEAERRFFARVQPVGFILFSRNVLDPGQLRRLVASLRESVGRADAPVMIDQEGGRVQRLGPPRWRKLPAAAEAGAAGQRAAWLLGRLIAADLAPLGIDVACAPVLDVPVEGANDVIGDRAFAREPGAVAALGRACAEGLAAGGVAPVIKHIPGHGRAMSDTHHALPRVAVSEAELQRHDFAPFRALNELPWAMTAHVVYEAIDAACATVSRTVIERVIRGEIGFDGVLVTDDLSMNALAGTLAERAAASRHAGCDVVLHCNGKLDEMTVVAEATGRLGEAGARRLIRALTARRPPEPFDADAGAGTLRELLG